MPKRSASKKGKARVDDDALLDAAIALAAKERLDGVVPPVKKLTSLKGNDVHEALSETIRKAGEGRMSHRSRAKQVLERAKLDGGASALDEEFASAIGMTKEDMKLEEEKRKDGGVSELSDEALAVITKTARRIFNSKKGGMSTLKKAKEIQEKMLSMGPKAALESLGVRDKDVIAQFDSISRKMAGEPSNPGMDVDEMARRMMNASTLEDVEEKKRLMGEIPTLGTQSEEDILTEINSLAEATNAILSEM